MLTESYDCINKIIISSKYWDINKDPDFKFHADNCCKKHKETHNNSCKKKNNELIDPTDFLKKEMSRRKLIKVVCGWLILTLS